MEKKRMEESVKLLTTKEVAALFKLSPTTLEMWRAEDKGPKFIKVGRYVRYSTTDLKDYVRRQTRGSDPNE
tara:strand:+ start:380 stop:592 length:213 start_codon:yes stop_codon:yes gene_type:complete